MNLEQIRTFEVLDSLFKTGWKALHAGREREAQAAFDEIIVRGKDPSGLFSGFVGGAHIGRGGVLHLRIKRSDVLFQGGPGVFSISSASGDHLLVAQVYQELFDAVKNLEKAIEVGQGTALVYSFLIGAYVDLSQAMGGETPSEERLDWIAKASKHYVACPEKTSPIVQQSYARALAFRAKAYLDRWRDLDPMKRHRSVLFVFGNQKDKGRDSEFYKEAKDSAKRALSVLEALGDDVPEETVAEVRKITREVLDALP